MEIVRDMGKLLGRPNLPPKQSKRDTSVVEPKVTPTKISGDALSDLSQNLLEALECPVCFEYMTPPITLCENGHNICSDCKPRLANCPTCRCPLIEIRNVTLENITRDLSFPCPNSEFGCTTAVQPALLSNHLAICNYRIHNCIFLKADGCKWQGKRTKIKDHITRYHRKKILRSNTVTEARCIHFEISNAECFNECCYAVFEFGELFLYTRRFDIGSKKLYMAVQLFGNRETAEKFHYKFRMSKANSSQWETVTSKMHLDSDNIETLFEASNCIAIDFDHLMQYMKGNKIFKIKKIR